MNWFMYFLLLTATMASITSAKIVNGPYLQNVTANSITVMWLGDAFTEGYVEYGLTSNFSSIESEMPHRLLKKSIWVYEIVLSELEPGTSYHYRVICDRDTSGDYTFTTEGKGDSFRFVVYGDSRGDYKHRTEHPAIAQNILKSAPDIIVHTGDFVDYGDDLEDWQSEFFEPAACFLPYIPFFPSVGNHELKSRRLSKDDCLRFYQDILSVPPDNCVERYYYFDYKNARFIILDSNIDCSVNSPQFNWLDSVLNQTNKDWVFVIFHYPPYSSFRSYGVVREPFVPLFEQYAVDVVFNAHCHQYERSCKDDIYYIVTAGGGAGLCDINEMVNPYQICARKIHHHCVIDINANHFNFQAIDINGTVFDSFAIHKSDEPQLSLSTNQLNFDFIANSMTFTITNTGKKTLFWNIAENTGQSWITSVSPIQDSLTADQSDTVTVHVERKGLADGTYSGFISISSNGGNQDLRVNLSVGLAPSYIMRLNAGGEPYSDSVGIEWLADRVYKAGEYGYVGNGGTYATTDTISRTDNDVLYQTERWGMTAYRFDVPNGNYRVVLHFAEIFCTRPNKRTMSVAIEDQLVLENIDLYQEAGHDVAVRYSYSDVVVTDDRLEITFSSTRGQPKIQAIEVIGTSQNKLLKNKPILSKLTIPEISSAFTLYQNYPNPFNSSTKIRYNLPFDSKVTLKIFNVLGKAVYTLEDSHKQAGIHSVVWNAHNELGGTVTSGIYFYQIEIVPDSSEKHRLRMMKKMFYSK